MDKPLRKMDHVMFNLNDPTSLVTITGMMVFKRKISKQALTAIISERLLKYERFHKKVILKKGKPHWHADEAFDIHSHLHHIALPSPGNYLALQEVISDLLSQPLDASKPLWQVHLIDNYQGGSVIIWRLHHAIADGIALVHVVLSLTGSTRSSSLEKKLKAFESSAHPHSLKEDLHHLWESGKAWYGRAEYLVRHPKEIKEAVHESTELGKELGNLLFGRTVSKAIYKGELCCSKKVAWSEALPLDNVKLVAKQYHATVNDVMLAMVTGALRRHLIKHKQHVNECIRVAVPVNVRKPGEVVKLHNEIGMISIELPVHIKSIEKRITFIHEKMELLKHSIGPVLIHNLINLAADILSPELEHKVADFLGTRIAGVVTNVPGPRQPIYFAGQKVEDMLFWVPQTNPLGVGVSIMSYNNRMYIGIVTDLHLVNDPDVVIKGFYSEYKQMEKLLKTEIISV